MLAARFRWPPRALAVSPNGRSLVALANDRLTRWDTDTGERTDLVEPTMPRDAIFTPDGKQLILASQYQNLVVRDATDLRRIDKDREGAKKHLARVVKADPDGPFARRAQMTLKRVA